jgi:hypothetical protein
MSELRYEPVPENTVELCEGVRLKHFINLDGARIMYIFDNKKKSSGGRIVVARIKKMNDEMKYLAMANNGMTYDYCMFIDKQVWEELDQDDRRRVAFHEFCHCDVDMEKKNPYGIKDHEIQGFYDEQDFNSDDPRWGERVSIIAESIYDKDE